MTLTSRQAIWVFVLAVTLAVCGTPKLSAGVEGNSWQQYDPATNPNYQQGVRDGRDDRMNNRPHVYRERSDARNNNVAENRAYEAGYDQGFGTNNSWPNRDGDRNDYNANNPNFQQGLRDGQDDRMNNRPHVYRERNDIRNNDPVQNRNYEAGYDQGFRTINGGFNRDGDRNDYNANSPNFQQGLRDGREDRANNRPHVYRERSDARNNNIAENRAYEAGYDQGFGTNNSWPNRDGDRNDYNANSPNFQQGLRDGRDDRTNNRPHLYRERSDARNNNLAENRAYEAGYDQGFRDNNNDLYGNGRQGEYGQGQYGSNAAARNGFKDGFFDGQKDRQKGLSNRSTRGEWYRTATRGYDSSQGNRAQYRAAYRQSYTRAYERGYTGQ